MEARMIKAGRREYVQVLRLLETFDLDDLHAAVKSALRIPPAAQIRRRHRKLPRHDLERLAPQHPQHRVPLATRRHAPLPARSRDRSDI
jgi:hypothetical protein